VHDPGATAVRSNRSNVERTSLAVILFTNRCDLGAECCVCGSGGVQMGGRSGLRIMLERGTKVAVKRPV